MAYKIEVDKETCIGCGACVSVCDDLFELNEEEMKAHVKKEQIEELGCAKEAEDTCPVDAIKITEQ